MERSREEVGSLIVKYQWMVRKTALRYFPSRSRDEDMLQCGMIGLWEAAKSWQTSGKFSSYAIKCIKHAMYDYLRSESKAPIPTEHLQEEETDDETETIDRVDLTEKIKASWPENSRERYILIALSSGASMQAAAIALGVSLQTAKTIAEKAMAGLKKEDGD